MGSEVEELRRRLAEAEREIDRLRTRNEGHVHAPTGSERTSAADADLLFTAAEKTRMPQIVTDPNLPDNPIVFANRAFQELCGYGAET